MKPLSQYPKHKRKKISKIRKRNLIRRNTYNLNIMLQESLFGFVIESCEKTLQQLHTVEYYMNKMRELQSNPHNFPIWPKGKECIYACKCGKKITVVVNKYDNSNSGVGRCECGATMYVN